MFDLNEPADADAAPTAPAQVQEAEQEQKNPNQQQDPPKPQEEEEEEGAYSGLSLLARSAEQWKKQQPPPQQQQEPNPSAQEEIQLEKPSSECRGLSPVSSEDNDDNVSSAAKQWSLRMTTVEEESAPPAGAAAAATPVPGVPLKQQERSSSWPRSERPSLMRSTSFHMLFSDDRPKSPLNNNVDSVTENGRMEVDEEEGQAGPDRGKTPPSPTGRNLCEFLQLKTIEPTDTTTTINNSEVSTDEKLCSTEIDLIDAFGQEHKSTPAAAAAVSDKVAPVSDSAIASINSGSGGITTGDPSPEDSRFRCLVWQGQVTFRDVTLTNMVAACTAGWQHVFKNRSLPNDLAVQRFVSTDKFVYAVKEHMAEPGVRVMHRSGTSSQNLNKLVQVLVGGGTGIDPDLSLHAPAASKGPLVAIVPLHDDANTWFADLHLVAASVLTDAEPGELSSSEEDVLYGFLCLSSGSSDESYTWLKEDSSNRAEAVAASKTAAGSEPFQHKSKKQQSNGDVTVEKRAVRSSSELSGDNRQDLEEGQLVSEDLGVKEVIYPTYERRKRYTEEEKKIKTNGDTEVKTRDRHRHRDHERERDQDRRRDRDLREVDHRERDREGVYTRRGNYEYLPRIDTKGARHRDGDKERHRGDAAWENGRGPSTRERLRESERSKSKERIERDRPAEKMLKEPSTRSKPAIKSLVTDSGKNKSEVVDKKKRDRSPMDSYRGNGKRLRDGVADEPKVALLAEKLAAYTDDTRLLNKPSPRIELESEYPKREKGELSKQPVQDSEELSSSDLKSKGLSTITGVDGSEVYIEMFLDSCDQDARSWLASKQNAVYLREDYGVTLLRKESSSSDLTTRDQQEPLHLKLSARVTETCDATEAKYFVNRAAGVLRRVAQGGVFSKCLWYPGPVQPFSGDTAPQIHVVVRKIKGDDGKNLDRIQDTTGVMVGMILDAESNRSVGLKLKTARKKGLAEATQQAHDLLYQVAAHFAKEMDIPCEVAESGPDAETKKTRPLYVTQLPEYASARMLRAIFENVLREKLKKDTELPPGFEQTTEMVSDVKYASDDGCAFVEFASDDLLEAALNLYKGDKDVFCGLKVELPSPAALKTYDQLVADAEAENAPRPITGSRVKVGKEIHASGESECDYGLESDQLRAANGDTGPRKAVKPLFLTELIRNASSESVKRLFEEVIANHINPALDGKSLVLAVRHIPSRGCMFVDLATPELVEFMLDLHNRKPDVFGHMKMELGRSHAAYEGPERKRSFHALERSRSERNMSPRPKRRAAADNDGDDNYEEGYGRQLLPRKQRSDPEKTVYADHLPENSSDVVIRKIFRSVLLEHMTAEQRAALGDDVVTEVRHVKTKYCAFVVFVTEDLARLALELYNRDEEIFDHMRLKPHFNSRLEDMYKEDGHDRDEDGSHAFEPHTRNSTEYEFQEARGGNTGGRGSRGFKEVDRRRSVYVDRIPDKYPESAIKEVLDRFLRRKGRGSPSYVVSHVSFFRDKYDSSKLCAFVEVKNEDAVQDLLDCYAADEGAFEGMRIRPAVKYN